MKTWAIKRDDDSYLQAKNGTVRLFKTRADAVEVIEKTKGVNMVKRVEITDA